VIVKVQKHVCETNNLLRWNHKRDKYAQIESNLF